MNSAQRIARNSVIPIGAQLVNKAVDVAFMLYVLRVLGTDGTGRYEFAVTTWLLTKTISDFGLNVLATREIARQPATAGHWLGGGTIARLLVLIGLLPLLGLLLAGYLATGRLAIDTALAVLFLTLSIAPGALSDSATAVFNGHERMTTPALVTVLTTLLKVLLAVPALIAGWGVIGLAGTALIVNGLTALVLWRLVRPLVDRVEWWPGWPLLRQWLALAWPLLLNNLLINLYFFLDTYVIQASRGEAALGLYKAAGKFINVTLIVPPYLTLALFPQFARQAEREPAALRQTLRRAIAYLVILALPIAIVTSVLADWLILILAGREFLPGAADALRIMIWFLPFSYANGLIQYGLIALNKQRTLTSAFIVTMLFNLVANLVLVPMYGILGAAAATVASELVLLGPLLRATEAALGELQLPRLLWRPIVATLVMALAVSLASALGEWLAVGLGLTAYLASLLALGVWGEAERRLVRSLLGRQP